MDPQITSCSFCECPYKCTKTHTVGCQENGCRVSSRPSLRIALSKDKYSRLLCRSKTYCILCDLKITKQLIRLNLDQRDTLHVFS